MNHPAAASSPPLTHYENFPVASWLCPPRLRPAIAAIYWFARTADDMADEGDAPAQQRLDDLAQYRADLAAVAGGEAPSPRWPRVFGPLGAAIQNFKLPVPLLADLLSAFEQDVAKTRDRAGYVDRDELFDYCRRSANPVGRLLLHLYGVHDANALARSDCICTALQLINFWQDLGLDIARDRFYLPARDCDAHGVTHEDLLALRHTQNATDLIATHVEMARATMLKGSALVHQVPGRAGWELRLVVQGGLRILDKIEAMGFATLSVRPKLTAWDVPVMLWRSLWM
ncbi:squalene synthase HpnC [Rhodoferax sediminis]|uniref:squalene synthase HpnC n=1 Tax=Rhodoferax sediminis TaxID=2509614 RepID=UPI001FCF2347|nr:squalene synthase HpnC [Rhodoferax sediminis]